MQCPLFQSASCEVTTTDVSSSQQKAFHVFKSWVKSQRTEANLKDVGSLAGVADEPVDESITLNIEILVVKVQYKQGLKRHFWRPHSFFTKKVSARILFIDKKVSARSPKNCLFLGERSGAHSWLSKKFDKNKLTCDSTKGKPNQTLIKK